MIVEHATGLIEFLRTNMDGIRFNYIVHGAAHPEAVELF
jgi:hypothetical protein